jgi:hypothetical protein
MREEISVLAKTSPTNFPLAGLEPAIQVFAAVLGTKTWVPGSSPGTASFWLADNQESDSIAA